MTKTATKTAESPTICPMCQRRFAYYCPTCDSPVQFVTRDIVIPTNRPILRRRVKRAYTRTR